MSNNWFFFYQRDGKESKWNLELSTKREQVVNEVKPAFSTVLDLSSVPDDNDWSKVRYRGGMYFDLDADGDLDLVCEQFGVLLGKLDSELDFDVSQARFFASGSKGFHIEIPEACFQPKVSANGTTWLPYIYRAMAESLMVDTLDLTVYTGKRGRQWRTTNVKRENGMYKVPLTLEEALSITPDLYRELIQAPRKLPVPTPPVCNSKFAMLFERSKDKIVTQMRGKKKRAEKANAILDPWKKARKTPPTIEGIMSGEIVAESAGFQSIAMQLAIYAASVEMPLPEFLDRCKGLCESHQSDSRRYNTVAKRREELSRMWQYMSESSLYDFDVGPIARLVKPGVPLDDLGVMAQDDDEDQPAQTYEEGDEEDGDGPTVATPAGEDAHKGVRKGFFMNGQGMWKRGAEGNSEPVCRATLRNVESFFDLERREFKGYEFDIFVKGKKRGRTMLAADAFTSAQSLRKFFVAQQLSFQGGEPETMALFDIMSDKASRGGQVYTWPREGFFIINNPAHDKPVPVKVYLTQDTYLASVGPDDDDYFRLRYRPTQAISSYNIDIHRAPELGPEHAAALHDLFNFTRSDIAADMIGWFVACHYRSAYLNLFNQFPLLQVYGEAGAGKSQTVWLLAHLHWYLTDISVKSAASCTPFAMDSHASSSTSAPFILDEFKPRELRQQKGKYEKIKDVLKACYIGADIGERGTINKGAESHLAIVKSKATAPIVFMGEAIEMETAIIERSVCVNLSKSYQTRQRQEAFKRLHADPTALSAVGRAIVECGFALDLEVMRQEVREIQADIEARMPDFDDETRKRAAPRLIYNRAVVVHGLRTLKRVLQRSFGDEFDADIDALTTTKSTETSAEEARVTTIYGMSEISKVLSRIALLSRAKDEPWEVQIGIAYLKEDGYVELRVEHAYDRYRRYCAAVNDTPLFDSLDAFSYALNSYSPVIDKICASSPLRDDGSTERIVRFDMRKLTKEGVQAFR